MSPFDHQAMFNKVEMYRNENRNFQDWKPYRAILESNGVGR